MIGKKVEFHSEILGMAVDGTVVGKDRYDGMVIVRTPHGLFHVLENKLNFV